MRRVIQRLSVFLSQSQYESCPLLVESLRGFLLTSGKEYSFFWCLLISFSMMAIHAFHFTFMQKQQPTDPSPSLSQQLLQLGFDEQHIAKALKLTSDIEVASEIILKLGEEGPQADLSAYLPSKEQAQSKPKPAEILINPFSRSKMLFVVNGELKMGKGKICAQVGHAVIGAYIQIEQEARYQQRARTRLDNWQSCGSPKIVLRVDKQQEMLQIKKKINALGLGITTYLVHDAGHTQIKAGSMTVLGIGPAFPEQIDPITQHLKLL